MSRAIASSSAVQRPRPRPSCGAGQLPAGRQEPAPRRGAPGSGSTCRDPPARPSARRSLPHRPRSHDASQTSEHRSPCQLPRLGRQARPGRPCHWPATVSAHRGRSHRRRRTPRRATANQNHDRHRTLREVLTRSTSPQAQLSNAHGQDPLKPHPDATRTTVTKFARQSPRPQHASSALSVSGKLQTDLLHPCANPGHVSGVYRSAPSSARMCVEGHGGLPRTASHSVRGVPRVIAAGGTRLLLGSVSVAGGEASSAVASPRPGH